MQYPLTKYKIGLKFLQPYGSVLSKLLGNKHMGVDLLPDGDYNIRPMKEGVVTLATMNGGDCGGLVDIDYGNGLKSRYCHQKAIYVKSGDKVGLETIVGLMGGTGTSYPKGFVHLHWVTWLKGVLVDPLSLNYGDDSPISKVNAIFRAVWKREPAVGESLYFQKRVVAGSLTEEGLTNLIKYWYGVVYPSGRYSIKGDARWQYEKFKWRNKK